MNTAGVIFLPGGENLRRSYFDDSEIVNTENQLKSKLARSVLKEYEIKTKMVQAQRLLLKRMFLFFIRLN